MSPQHFVEVRKTWGGPAPSETDRAIGESKRLLAADRAAWRGRREALEHGRGRSSDAGRSSL